MNEKPKKLNHASAIGLHFALYIILLLLISFIFTGCNDTCEVERKYTYYEPVYTSFETLRSAVDLLPPAAINKQGKIFFKNNYLFINEPNAGIHVIDNDDPKNPNNVAFINVPGSFDMVISGNLLYTDSYIDLVIIDISDIMNSKEINRLEGVFSNYNTYGYYADPTLGVVSDWVEVEEITLSKSDCRGVDQNWGMHYESGIAFDNFSRANAVPSSLGIAGSTARFALTKNHLYTIDESEVQAFDLSTPKNPNQGTKLYIDWGIETLFPTENNLFIGAQNGMHILELSDPLQPTLLSTYTHVNSCDPVIVEDDYAYVTLRSGNNCAGFTNQLEVINISDLSNPKIEYTYGMTNPHGLGKDGDALFICDGNDGLKVFDAKDIAEIGANQVAHYQDIQAYDIIPYNNTAMMIGEDGLYQYDYSDLNDIKFLSYIKIGQ